MVYTLINEKGKHNFYSTEDEIRFQSWWNEIYCFKIGSSSLPRFGLHSCVLRSWEGWWLIVYVRNTQWFFMGKGRNWPYISLVNTWGRRCGSRSFHVYLMLGPFPEEQHWLWPWEGKLCWLVHLFYSSPSKSFSINFLLLLYSLISSASINLLINIDY